ncbi:MAG TPA: hypothetical protein PKA64_04980 [Myxococcota bacterium]|nr:hypothetical protein [Myxococcota bacterium]
MPDETDEQAEGRARGTVLSRLARRLRNPGEIGEDAMDLVGTLLESSDRVKTEAVRMIAREVRGYLEALKLDDYLRELITSHSLEVKVSLSLKPLPADEGRPAADSRPAADKA